MLWNFGLSTCRNFIKFPVQKQRFLGIPATAPAAPSGSPSSSASDCLGSSQSHLELHWSYRKVTKVDVMVYWCTSGTNISHQSNRKILPRTGWERLALVCFGEGRSNMIGLQCTTLVGHGCARMAVPSTGPDPLQQEIQENKVVITSLIGEH